MSFFCNNGASMAPMDAHISYVKKRGNQPAESAAYALRGTVASARLERDLESRKKGAFLGMIFAISSSAVKPGHGIVQKPFDVLSQIPIDAEGPRRGLVCLCAGVRKPTIDDAFRIRKRRRIKLQYADARGQFKRPPTRLANRKRSLGYHGPKCGIVSRDEVRRHELRAVGL